MSSDFLRRHAKDLKRNAIETSERAAESPEDWLLQAVAQNQRGAAIEAERVLSISEAEDGAIDALEWRMVGRRLQHGEVPLSLLAKLADPLNKLLLRAAYFARNRAEPSQGVGEDLTADLDLRLSGVAAGSARLFIKGNSGPDTTGKSALTDGVTSLFEVLNSSDSFSSFYERLGEIGESTAHALRDTLRALEQEECSVEVRWHSPTAPMTWSATFDKVVRLRGLLDETSEPIFRQNTVNGSISLLALNGRLQVLGPMGNKTLIRFNPRTQSSQVSAYRLGQVVTLAVTERVVNDPITGAELIRYALNPEPGLLMGT